jgi:hypothetical protein
MSEDPLGHDIILNPEHRKAFIQMLKQNLDSLRNQEIQLESQKQSLNNKMNEYTRALMNIERVDNFINNDGMSAVKIFCETHSEEMNKAQSSRVSNEEM